MNSMDPKNLQLARIKGNYFKVSQAAAGLPIYLRDKTVIRIFGDNTTCGRPKETTESPTSSVIRNNSTFLSFS